MDHTKMIDTYNELISSFEAMFDAVEHNYSDIQFVLTQGDIAEGLSEVQSWIKGLEQAVNDYCAKEKIDRVDYFPASELEVSRENVPISKAMYLYVMLNTGELTPHPKVKQVK